MNITLIGMAGVGKSTVGKELAKKLNYVFLDTDEIIEKEKKLKLYQIINKFGESEFLQIEETTVLGLKNLDNHIISTGGSVVYSLKAMEFLNRISLIVSLSSPFETISKNIKNVKVRGIIGLKSRSLKDIFNERLPLYEKYAHLTVKVPKKFNVGNISENIIQKVSYHSRKCRDV